MRVQADRNWQSNSQDCVKFMTVRGDTGAVRRLLRASLAVVVVLLSVSVSSAATSKIAYAAPHATSTYVVKPGDFLIGIASKLNVKLSDFLAANGFTLASPIYPGQTLIVPVAAVAAPAAAPTSHTVRSGDYLAGIASMYSVRFSDLLAINQFTANSLIYPGLKLSLPAGAKPAKAPVAAPTPVTAPAPVAAPTLLIHTVKNGDYLAGIASMYSVRFSELLSLNQLTPTSVIMAGRQLKLPLGAKMPTTTVKPTTPTPAASNKASIVVAFALAQVGKPYKFFTAGPDTFDCSGLSLAAYKQVGIALPHYSVAQSTMGTAVDWKAESIHPGDLVFTTSSHSPGLIGHLGIAISATQWVQAPRTGDVIRTGPIPVNSIVAVRRFVQ